VAKIQNQLRVFLRALLGKQVPQHDVHQKWSFFIYFSYLIIWRRLYVLYVHVPFTAKPAVLDTPNFRRPTQNYMRNPEMQKNIHGKFSENTVVPLLEINARCQVAALLLLTSSHYSLIKPIVIDKLYGPPWLIFFLMYRRYNSSISINGLKNWQVDVKKIHSTTNLEIAKKKLVIKVLYRSSKHRLLYIIADWKT
jgi:hypothetical protein